MVDFVLDIEKEAVILKQDEDKLTEQYDNKFLNKPFKSEMSFEQMLEEALKPIRNGEVVEGTVIDVKPDKIILNIGCDSDGIITHSEYTK